MDQITDKTVKSELNADAAPFISSYWNNNWSNSNNPTNDNNQSSNDTNGPNNNPTNNDDFKHWDFTGALDESYSALYFDDKPLLNEKIKKKSMNDINEWTDELDKDIARTLLNELYDEFGTDIDFQHIQTAMEMGIYNTLDAIYYDLADIWINAKKLEKSVHFKMAQIMSNQRLDTLKLNKIGLPMDKKPINHKKKHQPKPEAKAQAEAEIAPAPDPFVVLDDLIIENKVNNNKVISPRNERTPGSIEYIYSDEEEIEPIKEQYNHYIKEKTKQKHNNTDNNNIINDINHIDIIPNLGYDKSLHIMDMYSDGDEQHNNKHHNNNNNNNMNMNMNMNTNQQQNTNVKNKRSKNRKRKNRNKNKNKNKQQNNNKNKNDNKQNDDISSVASVASIASISQSPVHKYKQISQSPEHKHIHNNKKNNNNNNNNDAISVASTTSIPSISQSPIHKYKTKNKTRDDVSIVSVSVSVSESATEQSLSSLPPLCIDDNDNNNNNNNNQNNQKDDKEKRRNKYKNKKMKKRKKQLEKEKKKKLKQKHKNYNNGNVNKNKNKNKSKQNKNKNKNNNNKKQTKNTNNNNNKKQKEKEKEPNRNEILSSMSVSQLKTILKKYMEEKDFKNFCEKNEFVSKIISYETAINERKKKWQIFRGKYALITKDIICINHIRYSEIHKLAENEKILGNEELKKGNLDIAIKHYTSSIKYQIDYKPAYTNRSLVYLKLKKYDKCITDCTTIIEMIKIVDNNLLKSNEMFKSYLRRGQAYKLQRKYFLAKHDFELAIAIRTNDTSVNKLLSETRAMCKKFELRKKLRAVGSVNDFTSVLSLSMELLSQATISGRDPTEDVLVEWKESDELLRRLFVFLYKNKKCCMLFARDKGHILCLKYLRSKFDNLGGAGDNFFNKENMGLLGKLYSLLNRSMPYIELTNDMQLLSLVSSIIISTFKYFSKMYLMRELQTTAMRFVSLVVGNDSTRNYIVNSCGREIILYFSEFKFEIGSEPAKGLFESLSFLLRSSKFLLLLLKQKQTNTRNGNGNKYIYETFLDWFCVYNLTLKKIILRKKSDCDAQKPLQFAISVLLDALTLIFDGAIKNPFITLSDIEKNEMKISMEIMISDFIFNNKTNCSYILNLKNYFTSTHKMFLNSCSNREKEFENENESVAYLSQTAKCMNVFTALSNEPSIDLLFKHNIYFEFQSLIAVCNKAEILTYYSTNIQMQNMLSLIKNNIMDVFDHISDDKRIDNLFTQYYWKYIMKIFIEKYKGKPYMKKSIQQFGHNKSCAIRCVYRWLHRCRGINCKKTNKILEIIILKYFIQIMDCLLIQDEQVLANVPLVLSECVKYILYLKTQSHTNITQNNIKLIQFVKKSLTKQRIIQMIKLMKTKHTAIQYNAMLLVAQISEIDQELHRVCSSLGALKLLAKYDEARKAKNVEKLLEEPLSFD